MTGGAYKKGASFDVTRKQTRTGMLFSPRYYEVNGTEEAFNDGTNASWAGNTFTSYGGQTRTDVSPALTPPTGLISTPSAPGGKMSYGLLRHSYFSTIIGNERPTIGITTNRGMGFIAENFLPHQIVDTTQPEINWPGFKFDQATIVMSQYAPGQDGVNDAFLGNYLASAGETFTWLNFGPQGDDAYIRLYVAQSNKFAFGFTGFKGA